MANKRISTLPNTDSIPDGSVFPVVMGDGTGTKQVSKETMKKEIGGSARRICWPPRKSPER